VVSSFPTLVAACGALLLVGGGLHAQGPVTRALQERERVAARNLMGAAEAMPEDRFAFKPTPPHMSFGELVVHVATSNMLLCSALAGEPPPPEHPVAGTDPKDLLMWRLKASFDLCNAVLEHADDSFLHDVILELDGRRTSRAEALIELASMWADHYSQMAMYLRLNGLEPPTAKRKER
jgi:uncharacterized damage-inducible protein DinB